jgi:hypothetical protein
MAGEEHILSLLKQAAAHPHDIAHQVGFCVKEGLAPASFHGCKRRLNQPLETRGGTAEQALVPVQIVIDTAGGVGNLEVR